MTDTAEAFGRPGQPVEIAPVYVTLASDQGSYATGQVYGSSGGAGFPQGAIGNG